MPISWNEIRHNAIKFSGEWKGAKSESAEKQTFWNEFFQVFGIKRRVVASFEEPASPFRQFTVRCLKCGSYRLRLEAQFDEAAGEIALFLSCPNCQQHERVPVKR